MLTPPKTQLQQQKKATAADHQMAIEGGDMMPVLGGTIQELQSAKPTIAEEKTPAALAELVTQGAPRGSKLKISIEKKIENIWLESQELGWSYNDFVSHLLEVLVVLNHRSVLPILNSNTKNSEKAKAS
jgi:hypothetical protein